MDWNSIETWRLIDLYLSLGVNAWLVLSSLAAGAAKLLGIEITADLLLSIALWILNALAVAGVAAVIFWLNQVL